jgi:hypothetical protein
MNGQQHRTTCTVSSALHNVETCSGCLSNIYFHHRHGYSSAPHEDHVLLWAGERSLNNLRSFLSFRILQSIKACATLHKPETLGPIFKSEWKERLQTEQRTRPNIYHASTFQSRSVRGLHVILRLFKEPGNLQGEHPVTRVVVIITKTSSPPRLWRTHPLRPANPFLGEDFWATNLTAFSITFGAMMRSSVSDKDEFVAKVTLNSR